MKKIGIIGSRECNDQVDYDKCEKVFLGLYEKGDIIVSGGCKKGGDAFAKNFHVKYCIPYLEFPADWNGKNPCNNWSYNQAAGFQRNTDIANESDILIAVLKTNGGGAYDTVKKFRKRFEDGMRIIPTMLILIYPDEIKIENYWYERDI